MNATEYVSLLLTRLHKTYGTYSYQCSEYLYIPQTQESYRTLHHYTSDHIELPMPQAGYDISLLSCVAYHDQEWHIPTLDAATHDLKALQSAIDTHFGVWPYTILSSGRSFHVYFETFITTDEWIDFLADALLLNMPDQDAIIDARWIAHRLKDRTGSLRLTSQQSHYLQEPTVVYSQKSIVHSS